MKRALHGALLSGLAALLLITTTRADAGAGADGVAEPLRWLPNDIDAFVVVRAGAEVRGAPMGEAVGAVVEIALPATQQTRRAWSELARTLEWSEPEAFDEILGRRVVLLARGLWSQGGPAQWALVCDVTPDTEKRIRARLAAFPREIVAGSPLLSVEEGRFNLLVHRGRGETRLVVAPAESASLVRTLAVSLREAPRDAFDTLPEAGRLRELGRQGGGRDALAFVRFPAPIGGWWGGAFDVEDSSVEGRVITATSKPMAEVEAWSLAPWRKTIDEAAVFLLERIVAGEWEETARMGGVFDRVEDLLRPALHEAAPLRIAALALPNERGGLRFGGALQSADAAGAAEAVDRTMADAIVGLGTLFGVPTARHDFAGLFPASVRRVDVSGDRSFAVLGDEPLQVLWRMEGEPGAGRPGWWVAGTDEAILDRLAGAAGAPAGGEAKAYLSVASIRPRVVAEALRRSGGALPAALDGFGRIERVVWTTWRHSAQEMHGRIEVQAATR